MKILVSGGGTGGHITPILAVAYELKRQRPDSEVIYVGERNAKFGQLAADDPSLDKVYKVFAGKYRRYYGESWIKKLVDVKTFALNVRDIVYVLIGVFQAWVLLGKVRPDVILLKGGFVGVPVGLAATLRGIPFLTHDSDSVPGLANRLVSRWAAVHATGMPSEFYKYPKEKTRYVGVLVGSAYRPLTEKLISTYRQELNLPQKSPVLLITGGSHGAQRLNEAVVSVVPKLLARFDDLVIIHQVGKGNQAVYGQTVPGRVQVVEFMQGMERYTGAADVVVTRAGANTLAELGVQGKACIIVPNPQLTGGHQLLNAQYIADRRGAVVVDERKADMAGTLEKELIELLEYPEVRGRLAKALQSLTKKDATQELAQLIIQEGSKRAAGHG